MTRTITAAFVLLLLGATAVWADTLVLHNGRRIQGELVGVTGGAIDFEEQAWSGRRLIRVPRRDVARIEFEDPRTSGRRDEDDDRGFAGIPRGMRERQINVTSREAWSDTGIDVRAGQQIFFRAQGETRWGPNRRDDAAGERNSPYNAYRPLPDRPAAALIGRIGDDLFFIGGEPGPFRVRSGGRLYLGVNDDVLTDNTGALRVTVSY